MSSDEEEDFARLDVVESKLLAHDPTFSSELTYSSINSKQSALLSAFKQPYPEHDAEGTVLVNVFAQVCLIRSCLIATSRVHVNIERWRACETWFSPGMAGVDSAGLGEVIQNVLARFDEHQRGRLVNVSYQHRLTTALSQSFSLFNKNVFVTGAGAQLPGLVPRLHNAMRPILPPEMPLQIRLATDPAYDAWKGMALFSRTEAFRTVGISKSQYEEWGGERIRRWWGSNWNASVAPD